MRKTNHECQVAFDIDNTLILHRKANFEDTEVKVTDPYDGLTKYFVVHKPHVKLLKDYKARGYHVIAWSANGGDWAEAVSKAIFGDDIDKYIDECRTKLIKFVDDLPAEKVLGEEVWIDYE